MSSLLRLAPAGKTLLADVEEDIWPRIREFFSWAAQHPQLMGVALLFAGYVVKKTRMSGSRYVPGRALRPGEYGPPEPGHMEAWSTEGIDVCLIHQHVQIVPGVTQTYETKALSAFGVWLGNTVPALKPYLEQVSQTFSGGVGADVDITFGDVLLMGGFAALVGPALQPLLNLIPKL